MKSNNNEDIQGIIIENKTLFSLFDSVYLFGSSLNKISMPNDINLLLVYSYKPAMIANEIKRIQCVLEEKFNMPIDLTVLSLDELKSTDFLKKIARYIKII